MKRLLISIFIVLCFASIARAIVVGWGNTPVGGGCAYSFCETFDATGYDNTWSETNPAGTVDEDYATSPAPLAGTQSLYLSTTDYQLSYAENTFTATDNAYFAMVTRLTVTGTDNIPIATIRSGSNDLTAVEFNISVGFFQLINGTQNCFTSTGAWVSGTTYYLWVEYERGTGADSVSRLYVNTTATKPSSAGFPDIHGCIVTNGTSTEQASVLRLQSVFSTSWIVDNVFRNSSAIGDL